MLKFKKTSKEHILALKISLVILLLFILSFSSLVYIFHLDWYSRQNREFINMIQNIKNAPGFPNLLINEEKKPDKRFINPPDNVGRAPGFGIRDVLIINNEGEIFTRGIFDEIILDIDFYQNLRENEIIQDRIDDEDFLIYVFNKNEYKVFLVKDISSYVVTEYRLGIISLLLSLVLFIFIYYISLRLAKLTIEPIEEANKRLGEFNHNVAHELKTPIAILKSNIELGEATDDFKELVASSKEELDNMESMINGLLFLSESRELKGIEDIGLFELNESILQKIAELYKGKEIDYKITGNLQVKGNKFLLNSLFKNLIENAYKYSFPKTTIYINITKKYLEINNSGKTIAEEDLKNIFDPFYQVDKSRSSSGFGLGLSICKKIVELHNWNISFKSENEKNKVEIRF